MASDATTTINGEEVPSELVPFYEGAATDPQVRMAISHYYRQDPNPSNDGAAAVAYAARLRVARDRYDTDQRTRPMLDAMARATLCAAGCGGTRAYGAADALCAGCHATAATLKADDAAADRVAGGITRRELVRDYLDRTA